MNGAAVRGDVLLYTTISGRKVPVICRADSRGQFGSSIVDVWYPSNLVDDDGSQLIREGAVRLAECEFLSNIYYWVWEGENEQVEAW